ncbi:MAG: formamidopyrimidine-DNA glycosylase [Saprospiraceae bacterium]|jgi:formamidopyrimidine-DNA glycosylase
MPELPEVETARRGIEPFLVGHEIAQLTVRDRRLRWPVPAGLEQQIAGQTISAVKRRAKYILIDLDVGTLLLHLGMSGSVRIVKPDQQELKKHDHFDLILDSGYCLRYNDPRRFGSFLWSENAATHKLLASLGQEPLSAEFTGAYLHTAAKGRNTAIKQFIMSQQVVVGVGNIYASEALHIAGISPLRSADKISLKRMVLFVDVIQQVLKQAIEAGGTTLKDFTNSDGKPGYFKQALAVYDRANQPCLNCKTGQVTKIIQGQRATYYCSSCQK